jgi:hypothetical protein
VACSVQFVVSTDLVTGPIGERGGTRGCAAQLSTESGWRSGALSGCRWLRMRVWESDQLTQLLWCQLTCNALQQKFWLVTIV